MEWISVKDRLPKSSWQYMIYDGDLVSCAYFNVITGNFGIDFQGKWTVVKPLFWSVLPDPPKK